MYLSKTFIPILKNNPTEAKIKSHQLMLRTDCRKTVKEKTGKRPYTNINLIRI